MHLYTYQISQWRRVGKLGILLLDTTVKTGAIQVAPTWQMVLGHKNGTITDSEYTAYYRQILDHWWFRDPLFFEELLAMPQVALGCYCQPGKFCHRYLLVDFLRGAVPAVYEGEL